MCTKVMDRMTGSSRPRQDTVSFMESQNGDELSNCGLCGERAEVLGTDDADMDWEGPGIGVGVC